MEDFMKELANKVEAKNRDLCTIQLRLCGEFNCNRDQTQRVMATSSPARNEYCTIYRMAYEAIELKEKYKEDYYLKELFRNNFAYLHQRLNQFRFSRNTYNQRGKYRDIVYDFMKEIEELDDIIIPHMSSIL